MKDIFECGVTLRSVEEEEEKLDLTRMSRSFYGQHIIVDISSCCEWQGCGRS